MSWRLILPGNRARPFGLVLNQTLSQGLPVVALAEGGVPEIVTPQCGILASSEVLGCRTLVRITFETSLGATARRVQRTL
jgi:glycosyltransferase involved in cell wall biosynthesis